MRRRDVLVGAGLAVGAPFLARPAGAVAPLGFDLLTAGGGRSIWSIMETMPYIKKGRGVVVYMLTNRLCPVCQAVERAYPGEIDGLELRYVVNPDGRESKFRLQRVYAEAKIETFREYMAGGLSDEPFERDPGLIIAYNAMIDGLGEVRRVLNDEQQVFGTPIFFTRTDEGVRYFAGLSALDYMVRLVARAPRSAKSPTMLASS